MVNRSKATTPSSFTDMPSSVPSSLDLHDTTGLNSNRNNGKCNHVETEETTSTVIFHDNRTSRELSYDIHGGINIFEYCILCPGDLFLSECKK